MKPMSTRRIVPLAALAAATLYHAPPAAASDLTYFGSVDAIDATLPVGGGTFSGSLDSATDDDWVVFTATAGDSITVVFSTPLPFMDGAVFREVTNGVVEVGDVADVLNFNGDNTGLGQDLVVQHGPYGVGPNYVFGTAFDQNPETLNFTAAASGEYAIGISANNEGANGVGSWTVMLSGNTDPGCLTQVSEEIICHADGTTFTVNIEGLNACTGGTIQVTFTGSGGAVGEELCFTVIVDDGGFCCSTDICVIVPDCSEAEDLVCPADFDDDGIVGITDLLALLAAWGGCPNSGCLGDLDFDAEVGITDFLLLLSQWGPCT